MKANNKTHVTLTEADVKNAIIKYLYRSQGLSGIFDVTFKLRKRPIPSQYPQDCNYVTEFDGAEVVVDLNEK
jgi:hypothetical protein